MSDCEFPKNNRTWQIIRGAQQGGYAVGGFCVYNTEGVLAVIKAAERCRSPAIIQLFPWSLHFQGPAFIRFVADRAHNADVPISVHLDHCTEFDDAELALDCAFDSLMVDGSGLEATNNVAEVKSIVERARLHDMTVEAELGRMEGSEDGVPVTSSSVLTAPEEAATFVKETGVHFLAPSFGNYHGPYPPGGAEKHWQLDRLEKIRHAVGQDTPLVLHGTHPLADEMVKTAISAGMVKINQNRSVRQEYHDFVAENSSKLELTALQVGAVAAYARGIERMMRDVLGSAGKV